MIDLHSHILPKLCDGSPNLETSIQMARMAVADGITHLACTPHIYPPVYNNNTHIISTAIQQLQTELDQLQIPLKLMIGADTHLLPETMQGLKTGLIPTLNYSRYFLLEPSHHVPVNNFLDQIENFLNAGYIPIITHPERLKWVENHYNNFIEAAKMGAWLQLTAGAITGHFGRTAKRFAERFLQDGYVHILATDSHGTDNRPAILSEGKQAAIQWVGTTEAEHLVYTRPQAIINNVAPEQIVQPPALTSLIRDTSSQNVSTTKSNSWLKRWFN
ncbi:tyrosine-protein phosphatase [Thiolinea disciformis]|uniref:tyrosine-protein phosphatase n=1 Tax=Thiolinea disciformis TaxID=125614 RepID=UPI000363A473|nr:CpsB/CapC family capsule biosynthesis tyrosine phosphatase [Thiolinea disciformis]